MNTFRCWVVVLVGILLLPDIVAVLMRQGSLQKGKTCFDKGEFDAAIASFTEAIRLKPDYAEVYCARGAVYGMKGDSDKAIADFTEAIRLDPKLAVAYQDRGRPTRRKSEKAKAEEDFAQAKKLGYKAP